MKGGLVLFFLAFLGFFAGKALRKRYRQALIEIERAEVLKWERSSDVCTCTAGTGH